MRIAEYTFQCKFTSLAILPEFKGSTLRGGFGHALKRITCALRRQECASCLLNHTCAYAFLFEVKKVNPSESEALHSAQRPHPYVVVPPAEEKREYRPGEPLIFKIILFGRANDYLPHIICAVQDMGKSGLGKKNSRQGKFTIEQVMQDNEVIFTDNTLKNRGPLSDLALEPSSSLTGRCLRLQCLTPLRLKYANEFKKVLPFHIIIRAALRRYSTLETIYGDGAPDLDFKGISARATKIKTISSTSRWIDISRYSNRQQKAMKFGGIIGEMVFQGEDIAEFLPLLRYCQQTHIGKQTSFGLGRISVESRGRG